MRLYFIGPLKDMVAPIQKKLRCVVLARGSAALCLQLSEQVSIRRRIGQEDEFAPKTYIVGSPERLV